MMLLLARTGLTTPAVVGRGLSEGLGLARVATAVARKILEAAGAQGWWFRSCALSSCAVVAEPGCVLSRATATRWEWAKMMRRAGLRLLVIGASWPLVRAMNCLRNMRWLAYLFARRFKVGDASPPKLLDD
jgi:hypothetical protein